MWIKGGGKKWTIRDLKETRCHLETIEVPLEEKMYLREFDSVRKCFLPSGSLHLNLNRLHFILLEGKTKIIYLRRAHRIF